MRGAELRGWSVAGVPLIWTPDLDMWTDTAPLLFPIVGWTRGGCVRVDGQTYPLGLHGFARTSSFDRAGGGPDHASLILRSSAETRALYPFDFELEVTYRLSASTLFIDLAVRNVGRGPMPFACGLHPGFRWPFAGGTFEDYAVTFAEVEEPLVPVIGPGGLFTSVRRPVALQGRRLPLSAELFSREALCFLHARSRSLRFSHRDGAGISLALEGFPHLALWSRPPGRFLSIEAWTGYGDVEDRDGDGCADDLRRKPSMIHLAPGQVSRHGAAFTFSPTAGAGAGAGAAEFL